MVAFPKSVQAAKDAEQATEELIDTALHTLADHHHRQYLAQRRAARIREGREWAGVVAMLVVAIWCLRHWGAS